MVLSITPVRLIPIRSLRTRCLAALFVFLWSLTNCDARTVAVDALTQKHESLRTGAGLDVGGWRVFLESQSSNTGVSADVYSKLNQPLASVQHLLQSPQSFCGMLTLHLFIQRCEFSLGGTGTTFNVTMGGTPVSIPGGLQSMAYIAPHVSVTQDAISYELVAKSGPLGTSDYQIVVEAVSLDGHSSLLHMQYSYKMGWVAKLAMQAYQASAGRTKIGFTVVGRNEDGSPQYIQGERGSLERNSMRIFIALLASLSDNSGTAQQQLDKRRRYWFELTETFPNQLHEFSLEEYMKRKQETPSPGLE